jgi:hypothetical protein
MAWLGAGTETADRGVGKVTPLFRPSQRGPGRRAVQRGLQKMLRTRVSLQRRLADRGFAGRAGPRHGRQPVGGQLGSAVGTAGGGSYWSYQRPRRKPLTNQVLGCIGNENGRPNTVKGDGGLPLAMSLAYIDALHS